MAPAQTKSEDAVDKLDRRRRTRTHIILQNLPALSFNSPSHSIYVQFAFSTPATRNKMAQSVVPRDVLRLSTDTFGGPIHRDPLTAEQINNHVYALASTAERQGDRIDSLAHSVVGLEDKVESLDHRVGALENTVDELKGSVGQLTASVGGLQTTVGGLQATVGGLQTEVAKINTNVTRIAAHMDGMDGRITKLAKDVDAKVDSLDDRITSTADMIHAKVDVLDHCIADLSNNMDARFAAMDAKFDARFATMDAKFDAKFATMDAKFATLSNTMDARFATVDARLDMLNDNMAALRSMLLQSRLFDRDMPSSPASPQQPSPASSHPIERTRKKSLKQRLVEGIDLIRGVHHELAAEDVPAVPAVPPIPFPSLEEAAPGSPEEQQGQLPSKGKQRMR
ncbi:hypothetical protein BC628DRAFT_1335922 [Trametes gibbosa]|nr:hypothetical protein BC628DRAFT_1335922 [Trametes gibbosa]